MRVEQLIEEASRKLDEGDFIGAREDYRRAVMLAEPDWPTLSNLWFAENHEQLVFLKKLRDRYPNSSHAWFMFAHHYKVLRRYDRAVETYTEMLSRFGDDNREILHRVYWERLSAACKESKLRRSLILADISTLWEMGDTYDPARQVRWILLKILTKELDGTDSLPIFESLEQDKRFPTSVKALFQAKIAELRTLENAIEDVKRD